MKPMRVAFRRSGGSIYSRFIRLWTVGPYSHCELVFPPADGQPFDPAQAYCFSSSEDDGGCRFKVMDLRDGWDVLELPLQEMWVRIIRRFCRDEDGCEYDWRGISFSFLPIPIGWQHPDRWFCSEICAAALQRAGWLSGHTAASLSPNGLYKALRKELQP